MSKRHYSQLTRKKTNTSIGSNDYTHSQPSTSNCNGIPSKSLSQHSVVSEEQSQLTNKLLRYLLMLSNGKQVVTKARIVKNVLDNQGRYFHPVMVKVKNILSQIFGIQLVELEGNKYILVNEIENRLPHIESSASEKSQQVLLFLVLTHIFMHEQLCTEGSLSNFLGNLGIDLDRNYHPYFGDVKHLVSEVFVAQKYLDKITLEKDSGTKIEYKWGPRAETFSRRAAFEFVSKVYNGRPLKSWALQYNILTAHESSNQTERDD